MNTRRSRQPRTTAPWLAGVPRGDLAAAVGLFVIGLLSLALLTGRLPLWVILTAPLYFLTGGDRVGTLRGVILLSCVLWALSAWGIARLTRSLVLSLRGELFIEAAIACGTPTRRILLQHCLPNIVPALIVRASVGVGFVVMAEATLSFLGLGVQEPLPSWGGMIRDGLPALRSDPHLALAAGAALGATIVGFNLLGDGLRDLLDPRIRDR